MANLTTTTKASETQNLQEENLNHREQHLLEECVKTEITHETEEKKVKQQSYYYGYGAYYTTKKVDVQKVHVDINLPNGKIVCLDEKSCKDLKQEGQNVSFTLATEKATLLIGSENNDVYAIGEISSDGKIKVLDRNTSEAKKLLDKYNKREVNLNASNETFRYLNGSVEVERGAENIVRQITIRGCSKGDDIILTRKKDGNFIYVDKDESGKFFARTCSNLKLYKNGDLTFTTKEMQNGKEVSCRHSVIGGKYEKILISTSLEKAIVQICEYSGFGNTNSTEASAMAGKGNVAKIARGIGVGSDTQFQDAYITYMTAMKRGALPVFYTSSHGAPNYNQAVGSASNWIEKLNNARIKAKYNGPVMIEIQNCHSGLVAKELEAFSKFPAGAIIMTSQDQRTSQYCPSVSQSGDGETLDEAKKANATFSVVYFGGKTIVESNNPTVAVVGKDGEIHLFSKNGKYFVGGVKSLFLRDTIKSNNNELPALNLEKAKASITPICGSKKADAYLSNSLARFFTQCLNFASLQTNYQFSSPEEAKPIALVK